MANDMYLAVNNNGLAVSGVWNSDSLIEEGLTLVLCGLDSNIGDTWDGTSWHGQLISVEEVRRVRDEKLSSTDWVIQRHSEEVSDNAEPSLSPDKYSAWLSYRKDLRDITENYTPIDNPEYPTKPL